MIYGRKRFCIPVNNGTRVAAAQLLIEAVPDSGTIYSQHLISTLIGTPTQCSTIDVSLAADVKVAGYVASCPEENELLLQILRWK